jgi:hypothetical protein
VLDVRAELERLEGAAVRTGDVIPAAVGGLVGVLGDEEFDDMRARG